MLYPRLTEDGRPIAEEEMVGVREHLAAQHRILFLSGAIRQEDQFPDFLLAFDSLSHEPIKLIITSPGGDLDVAFLLYDTIKLIKSPVWTFGRYCASAAVLILAAGEKRFLSPHAKVMLHLPSAQAYGDARDLAIQHREMEKYKNEMVDILIACGVKKEPDDILRDIDRDFWLEPEEAIAYGLADKIVTQGDIEEWLKRDAA